MLLIYSESNQGMALYDRLATLDKPIVCAATGQQHRTETNGLAPI
jgi:hypothetical protein